jgi:hypothetical protein
MSIKEDYELMKLALLGVLKELGEIKIALDNISTRIINDKEKNKVLV